MRAERRLVGLEDVGAHYLPLALGDVGVGVEAPELPARRLRTKDISVARRDDRLKDAPDRILIGWSCGSNRGVARESPASH